MDTKSLIATVVAILAVFTVIMAAGTALFNEAEANRQKGIEMHSICIEAGYSGWDSYHGCIGGPGSN